MSTAYLFSLIDKAFPTFKKYKRDIIASASLITIICIFLIPSFIRKDFTGDFIGQEVPWYHFTFVSLKAHIIPFWSPYAFSGLPHLLKPELAFFHPITIFTMIILFLFNQNETIGITGQIMEMVSVLSACLGAMGVYIFSRKILTISPIPSLFASLTYSLNPFTLFQMHSISVFYGVNLLPWLVFFIVRFVSKPSFISFLFVILCNYLLLIGYSYYYVYFFFMQLGIVLFFGPKKIIYFFFGFFISLLFSSFFILSYLDIYSKSPRITNNFSLDFHSFASLNPIKVFEIINPISYSSNTLATTSGSLFNGPTLTWGTFAFIFLVYGLFSLKKSPVYQWIVIVLFVSFFYSFGSNLQSHSFFGNLIPLIYKFRFHARAFICTIFAGSLIIGLGMQTIKERLRIKYIEIFLWIFFLLIFVGLILGHLYFPNRISTNIEMLKGISITLLFLFSSLTITAIIIKYSKLSYLFIAVFVLVLEHHLFFQNFKDFFTKNISYDQFYKINSLIPEVPTNDNLFRMYFEDNQFAYNTSVLKIYNLNGYENNPYQSSGEKFNKYGMVRYYQLSNVKYIVTTTDNWQIGNPDVVKIKTINPLSVPKETFFHGADKYHYIYQLRNYMPRFYVPDKVEPCSQVKCLDQERLPNVTIAKNLDMVIKNPQKNVSIKIEEYTPNNVVLKVKTPQKTFIASSENWDEGWNITINSKPSTLYNTSNGFRGFIAPEGESLIEMHYFPPKLIPGILLSLIGVFILFMVWKYKIIEHNNLLLTTIKTNLKRYSLTIIQRQKSRNINDIL